MNAFRQHTKVESESRCYMFVQVRWIRNKIINDSTKIALPDVFIRALDRYRIGSWMADFDAA